MTAFILAHRVTLLTIAAYVLGAVVLIAIALSLLIRLDGHRAEDRREAAHARPPRLAAAWWWCRDRAAWLRWRARCAVACASLRLRRWKRLELSHEDIQTATWVHELIEEVTPHDHDGRTVQADQRSEPAGLHVTPAAVPASLLSLAGPSPELPPAVTQAFAAAWAIHGQFDGLVYDTGWFAAVTAGAS